LIVKKDFRKKFSGDIFGNKRGAKVFLVYGNCGVYREKKALGKK
jgi:hypothetical protein